MSPRLILPLRVALAIMALSLALLSARKGVQTARYFSPLIDLPGTVVAAELTDPIPLAKDNPRFRSIVAAVPTRLRLELKEYPGLHFQVALREDPDLIPPVLAAGEQVTLILPTRWRESEVGSRVLTMGLRRGTTLLVDPAGYPFAAEFRAAFVAVAAAIGAIIMALGAWKITRL